MLKLLKCHILQGVRLAGRGKFILLDGDARPGLVHPDHRKDVNGNKPRQLLVLAVQKINEPADGAGDDDVEP